MLPQGNGITLAVIPKLAVNHTAPGLTPHDVIGQKITQFVPPEYESVLLACFERVERTRERDFYETAYIDDEGNNLLFDTRVSPWIEEDELKGFALVSSQVTQREAMQVDMHRLFHLSQDLLVIGDNETGCFRYVNPAFERALGWSLDQLTARTPRRRRHSDACDSSWCGGLLRCGRHCSR